MKENEKKSVVFMGSGPVAAASLALLHNHFIVEAVVTKPTTKRQMSGVAGESPVYCVSNKKELDELFTTNSFASNASILIDFGILVSKKIIDYFPKGIINSHFSLLPELRGADPISFAILEGKQETGVSLMLLVEKMDEGPLLSQVTYTLERGETTPSLTTKLIEMSAQELARVVPQWLNGQIDSYEQDTTVAATYTRKLSKDDGKLDFTKTADILEREIRAYAEWPKSYTALGGMEVVIIQAATIDSCDSNVTVRNVCEYWIDGKSLYIQCSEGVLSVLKIKPAGKQEMDIASFINGYKSQIV